MVHPIAKRVITPVYHLWLRRVSGLENVPRDGPFIIAANHSSSYDTLLPYTIFTRLLDKQIHAFAHERYWKNPIFGMFVRVAHCLPVYPKTNPRASELNEQSFQKALEYLRQGHIIHIFPEGTRNPQSGFKRAKTGVARLALESGVPVLPMGVIDSEQVLPKGAILPRFHRAEVRIGFPLHLSKYAHKPRNRSTLEDATTQIMKAIGLLIGKAYRWGEEK